MKTTVYIDGFNLFYGALKGTEYKWLNLKEVWTHYLPEDCVITKVKYFTAIVSGKDDPQMPARQLTYLRALQRYIPEIDIHKGVFLSHVVIARPAPPAP